MNLKVSLLDAFLEKLKIRPKELRFSKSKTTSGKSIWTKSAKEGIRSEQKKGKMHPVDKARIIHQGMCAGEKMLQEERTATLSPTTKTTKDKKKSADYGAIRIKTKNVNSIKIDQGDREELVMNHLRKSQKN